MHLATISFFHIHLTNLLKTMYNNLAIILFSLSHCSCPLSGSQQKNMASSESQQKGNKNCVFVFDSGGWDDAGRRALYWPCRLAPLSMAGSLTAPRLDNKLRRDAQHGSASHIAAACSGPSPSHCHVPEEGPS
ncbi:hypothetical protein P4O66_010194 [Electrophorus voltai]|uniref:Uncharacterized protein n=1 Tax=Electrophorus voltai TaxID=2609070 RepID=A0AAD9DVT6_9TELE|nr:hypothetical protein P4O66_010194 [Electrophorus voltai]